VHGAGHLHQLIDAGTEFWHVYKDPYDPCSFNPHARGRFAAHRAAPPRSMFYAGDTADCALWETILRDIVPDPRSPAVQIPSVEGYHLARLSRKEPVKLLDLGRFGARRIAGKDSTWRNRLILLTTVPRYPATHDEAASLLARYPETQGLRWPSKQADHDTAFVFYDPPVSDSDFGCLKTTALDTPEGLALIDHALAQAHLTRMDDTALAAALEPELPPETKDDA
jgi:hypothetical protein